MKALAIVALICGLAAVGAGAYGMIETKPNYEASQRYLTEDAGNARMAALDQALYEDYAKALGRETVGSWAGGLFALVLGALAVKKRQKGLGLAAIVLGLAGAGLGFAIMPQPLLL